MLQAVDSAMQDGSVVIYIPQGAFSACCSFADGTYITLYLPLLDM